MMMRIAFFAMTLDYTYAAAFARTDKEVANLIMKTKQHNVENVPCSTTEYCQDGQHCCFYSTGQPAGCCADGLTCDVAAGTCDSSKSTVEIKTKTMLTKVKHNVENVPCSTTEYCQDGQHCCFYSTGQPAGCCTDGLTCDVAAGTCDP